MFSTFCCSFRVSDPSSAVPLPWKPPTLGELEVKVSAYNEGDLGSIPGSGRSPGEGNGNPLQCSCLENPMDRGAWEAIVHGIARVGHNLVSKPPPPVTR